MHFSGIAHDGRERRSVINTCYAGISPSNRLTSGTGDGAYLFINVPDQNAFASEVWVGSRVYRGKYQIISIRTEIWPAKPFRV